MRGRLLALGIAVLAGAGAIVGCSLILTFPDYVGDGCAHTRWPDRPTSAAPGGNRELVGAVKKMVFFTGADAGFDLDGLCTCPDKPACKSPKGPKENCDLPSGTGIDNVGGSFIKGLYPPNDELQASLDQGKSGLVIRVQGFNGTPNDNDVVVSVYNVAALEVPPAKYDGADVYDVDTASILTPPSGSKYIDPNAYISNGILVAQLELDIRLDVKGSSSLPPSADVVFLPLHQVKLVGRIEPVSGGGLKLTSATIAGRLTSTKALHEVGRLGLCQDGAAYQGAKFQTCQSADLAADHSEDGQDKACQAVSFTLQIDVVPAKLGQVVPARTAPDLCPGEPDDRCN